MATVFVVLKDQLLQDLQEFIAADSGEDVTVNRNYAVTKEVDIVDEEGNPTGETRTVFDYWDIVQEVVRRFFGGSMKLASRTVNPHGLLHFALIVSSSAILQGFAQDNPGDYILVGNKNNLDDPIAENSRNRLNQILPQSKQIPQGRKIKTVINDIGKHYGNANFNRLKYAMHDHDDDND